MHRENTPPSPNASCEHSGFVYLALLLFVISGHELLLVKLQLRPAFHFEVAIKSIFLFLIPAVFVCYRPYGHTLAML